MIALLLACAPGEGAETGTTGHAVVVVSMSAECPDGAPGTLAIEAPAGVPALFQVVGLTDRDGQEFVAPVDVGPFPVDGFFTVECGPDLPHRYTLTTIAAE